MPTERSLGGALVVSLDVDLTSGGSLPDQRSIDVLRRILDLLVEREIHATWACDPQSLGSELVASIAARPHQEIGALMCSDRDGNRFEAELAAAVASARSAGIELRSLVLADDRHRPELVPILARHGITSYRGPRPGWAHRPSGSKLLGAVRQALRIADNYSLLIPDVAITPERLVAGPGQPLAIPACRFLRAYEPRLRELESLRQHRLQSEMSHAAKAGRLYHLWLRPLELGDHPHESSMLLDYLLRTAKALAGPVGFRSLSMSELASERQVH